MDATEQLITRTQQFVAFMEFTFQQFEKLFAQPLEFLQFPFEQQRITFRRQLQR